MSKPLRHIWLQIAAPLRTLKGPVPPLGLVSVLIDTLRRALKDFGPLATQYGLNDLASLDPKEYPITGARVDPNEDLQQFLEVEPKSVETLAMAIRDLLWNYVAWQTEQLCPQCGNDQLRALMSEPSAQLVFTCDFCGFAELANGARCIGVHKLRPLTSRELAKARASGALRI